MAITMLHYLDRLKSLYSYEHIFYTNTIFDETNPCLTNSNSPMGDFLRTKIQKGVTKGIQVIMVVCHLNNLLYLYFDVNIWEYHLTKE